MSKTRKILTTLTMVAVTTTTSLTAISSAQAGHGGLHVVPGPIVPGPIVPGPGPIVDPGIFEPVLPGGGGGAAPTPDPDPAPPPRRRGGLRRGEAAALGVLGGVLIGSALANANRRQAQPAPAPAAGLPVNHYIYCDNKYRSYVAATNTFTGYDGRQHYCVSPYVY